MAKTVEKKTFQNKMPTRKRVAAYARVSSAKDAMHHSLSVQVGYYSNYIQSHAEWQYAGVYADEAKTGTKDSREQFQRLLAACRAGNIDIVITKSISRFARNTVTLLETVRELKSLGIDVFFEEQNIHTISAEGELMLTILASFAQAESLSASENQKWRVKKNFEEGKPWDGTLLGYRYKDGQYVIEPPEAAVVRRIFTEYISGKGATVIANELNAEGIPTRFGGQWRMGGIIRILRNYTYTGNLLLQKTFIQDYITKKKVINSGQLPKYHATDTHEAIIDLATFEAAQAEIERRAEKYAPAEKTYDNRYPFSGLIICSHCGKHYRRKVTHGAVMWICPTYNSKGKAYCASKQIPEEKLNEMTAGIGLADVVHITALDSNDIRILLKDGSEVTRHWQDRSRAESWTEEMKQQARQKALERRRRNG